MAFAELDKLKLHYELTGASGLPVLILSNSLGANLAMWEPQVSVLGSRFRLLRYDTRGHGDSSVPPGPYTIEDLGQDVLRLLDFLEIDQASFCGISMGGSTGQWLGVNASSRIHKLVLANTAAKIGVAEVWNARIETVLKEGLESIVAGTMERWFTAAFRHEHPEIVAGISSTLRSTNLQGYVACCAAIRDADFRAVFRNISVPTLAIAGSQDVVASPQDVQFLAENIPSASYIELSAAHLSNVEVPDAFNSALLGFLDD